MPMIFAQGFRIQMELGFMPIFTGKKEIYQMRVTGIAEPAVLRLTLPILSTRSGGNLLSIFPGNV